MGVIVNKCCRNKISEESANSNENSKNERLGALSN